jgi:iron complex outermembrane receptor protein
VPIAGAIKTADCGGGQTVVFSSGNPQIKPEKSQSWNLGVVLEPTKNLNVSVDFWQIERKNEILGTDAQSVLNNPAGYPTAQILRDASTAIAGVANSGTLLAVMAPYANGPSTKTNGVDVDMRYRFPTLENGIKLSGRTDVSYINTFRRTMPDGTTLNYAGTYGPTALSSSAGMPRMRGVMDLTAAKDAWSVTGRINYTAGIKMIESAEDSTCLGTNGNGDPIYSGCKVPSFVTMDVFGRYMYNKNLEISGSIQNLFDKLPNIDPVASYGITMYNPSYAQMGAIGRYMRIGVKYKFD